MSEHKPRARNTDPGTSHAAADSVRGITSTIRERVGALLEANPGGLTHDQIIGEYRKYSVRLGWPAASDSSIRTRVSELVTDGEAEKVPDASGKSRSGRPMLLWRKAVKNELPGT